MDNPLDASDKQVRFAVTPSKFKMTFRGTKKHATRVTDYHLYSAPGLIQMLISVFFLISDVHV